MPSTTGWSLLLALTLTVAAAAQEGPALPALHLTDAVDAETGTTVRRGVLRVWENREARAGRILELDVVVLPATGADPAPDPVFFVAGGPGQAAADLYREYLDSWMRERRDIVLMSQRGTGGSNRLSCGVGRHDGDLQEYLDPIFTVERFEPCRDALAESADLTQYSTCNAADDLNDLRAALGYERINLSAGSYGTRASLVYMRRHPETVRIAILAGVAPLAFTNPLFHAREAQDCIEVIFDECAADPDCAAAFPDLPAKFTAIFERLEREPATVTIAHPETGDPVTLRLDRGTFAGSLRIFMYGDSRTIPYLIQRAYDGDFVPFVERTVMTNMWIRDALAFGMLLCVTCAEDIDRIDPATIDDLTDGTFLGGGRVRAQIEVCGIWPRSKLPEGFGDPVSVDVQTLLISGTYDPVTSPRWGEEAARHLPNGRHVVLPISHSGMHACITGLMREALEAGTVAGLDVSCVEAMTVGPWVLGE